MIVQDKNIEASFYFKKEQELDSDGNAIYALFSKKRDGSDEREYASYIYIHIPENEDIDNLYFNIKNEGASSNLYFELDKPLNLYFETVKGSLAVMNLKSKIEIAQDLKLYVKDFYSDLAFAKSYIGFYDDEKNPAHNCDNKLYCDRLAITNVENSSILFKRGNYNSSDKSLKNLDWRSNSYGNYKIGGAFSFIKIEDNGFRTFKNSDNKASVLLKFDNLSERKATSLNIDKMKVDITDDNVKEIEISAPSILLNNTTIKASDLTRVKERVIKDSYGITASDVTLDINGTFDSYSQAGIYAKSIKNSYNSNTIYIKGESNSQVKGGSLNL